MLLCRGKEYLVVTRDDFFRQLEIKPLRNTNFEAVAQFLWEDVIYYYSYFERLIIDGGFKNKKYTDEFIKKYNIQRVVVSIYHPQVNGIIKREHKTITDGLAKMRDD